MTLRVPNKFKRAIHHDPGYCVLLVGAGLSATGVRDGGGGLPSWDALVGRMIDDLQDDHCLSEHKVTALRKALDNGKHLQLAEFYSRKRLWDQFAEFLREQLDPPDLCASSLHKNILRVGFKGVLSLNLDMVFEKSSPNIVPLVYPHCLDELRLFGRDGFFAKMHGSIRTPGDPSVNLILTASSYKKLRDLRYKWLLNTLSDYTFLTVGFSLRDPDFLWWIDDLREVFARCVPTIYSLMEDPGTTTRDYWRQRGVEILPYAKHEEIADFFTELKRMKRPMSFGFSSPFDEDVVREALAKSVGAQADALTKEDYNKVTELNLSDPKLSDLCPLTSAINLQSLDIAHTLVSDLSPLRFLGQLQSLDLRFTQVSDVSPLRFLTKLQTLTVTKTPVADLGPLADLPNLHTLYAMSTQASDLSLASITNLRFLEISYSPVSDLSPLRGMMNLETLNAKSTQISDLSPLMGLAKLRYLNVTGTQVTQEQVELLRAALPKCNIRYQAPEPQNEPRK